MIYEQYNPNPISFNVFIQRSNNEHVRIQGMVQGACRPQVCQRKNPTLTMNDFLIQITIISRQLKRMTTQTQISSIRCCGS